MHISIGSLKYAIGNNSFFTANNIIRHFILLSVSQYLKMTIIGVGKAATQKAISAANKFLASMTGNILYNQGDHNKRTGNK